MTLVEVIGGILTGLLGLAGAAVLAIDLCGTAWCTPRRRRRGRRRRP